MEVVKKHKIQKSESKGSIKKPPTGKRKKVKRISSSTSSHAEPVDITNLNQSIINHETREKEESVQKSETSDIISASEKSEKVCSEKSSNKSEKTCSEKSSKKSVKVFSSE